MKAVPRRPAGARRRPGRGRAGPGRATGSAATATVIDRGAAPARPRTGAARRSARRGTARRRGSSWCSAAKTAAARRDGEDFVLGLDDGRELRGDRLLVATGRRPRVEGIGLESVGIEPDPHGVQVDDHLRAGERPLGDRRRQRRLAADPRRQVRGRGRRRQHPRRGRGTVNYDAVPRVTYTDPQAAAVGAGEAEFSGTVALAEVAKTATYTHAYAEQNGFLTLLSDGERLTGAYALGPEAGEWLQQATLAIRARVPLDVLTDTIQPFPTFSEIYVDALKALRKEVAAP